MRSRLLVVPIALFAGSSPIIAQRTLPNEKPALVVLIAVDQMRPDYFARFHDQFHGGFRLIRDSSAFFPNAHQEHAMTETAPGHSAMLSGREPVHTGIFSNDRGVPDPTFPLIDAPGVVGASPRRFVGTTLFDWMRKSDSSTRVLSVSRKDRGAILPVGRAHADVYWFAAGRFTTSQYYAMTLPAWVRSFDDNLRGDALPRRWTLLLPDSAYAEPDSMPWEHDGGDFTFPHSFPDDPVERLRKLEESPWMDSLTLAFALRGANALSLGRRGSTDLLSISLSTTDKIGHTYGPDSREMHDHLLRLDGWVGTFLDSLGKLVPRQRTLIVLTSDHGMTSFPEYVAAVRHQSAGRMSLGARTQRTVADLKARYGTSFDFAFDNGILTADVAAMRARGVNVDSLTKVFVSAAKSLPGVAQVYTPSELAAEPASDADANRWKRNLPPEIGWLIVTVAKPNFVFSDKLSGEHGTMQPETVGIPIAFVGPGIHRGTYARVVRSVDIAPTLATLLGVSPMEALDGKPIPEVLQGGAPNP
ncbi:MAG TPA: alkaline phosphatase family protein [Gemmatimonadaceae bacterium]|jgi:arylsulfatase A-like enzyme